MRPGIRERRGWRSSNGICHCIVVMRSTTIRLEARIHVQVARKREVKGQVSTGCAGGNIVDQAEGFRRAQLGSHLKMELLIPSALGR